MPQANTASERQTIYQALSPAAQLVAQVYGAVAPSDPARARVVNWLAQADLLASGERITQNTIKDAMGELMAARLIEPGRKGVGPRVTSGWALFLTLQAQANNFLDAIVLAYDNDERDSSWWDQGQFRRTMLLRYLVVSQRFGRIDKLGAAATLDWSFMLAEEARELWKDLPAEHRKAAVSSCLRHVLFKAAPVGVLFAVADLLAKTDPVLAGEIALVRVIRGDFVGALSGFQALSAELAVSAIGLSQRASVEAFIATLRGDDATAVTLIDDALIAERGATKKRNVFPRSRAFGFALLSLVRIGSPDSLGLLNGLLRTAEKESLFPEVIHLVRVAEMLSSDRDEQQRFWRRADEPDLLCLFGALMRAWGEKDFDVDDAAQELLLINFMKQAEANGYWWILAEGTTLLERANLQNATRETLKKLGDSAQSQHTALGTVSLADVVIALPDWEYPLKALEQLAFKSSNTGPRRASAAAAQKRLQWQIEEVAYGPPEVVVREQKANRSGEWSRGRVVALKRLHTEVMQWDYALEQDRAAAAAIKVERSYGWGRAAEEYNADAHTLYELKGHPYVVNADGQSIEVVLREPELVIEEIATDERGGRSPGREIWARLEPLGADKSDYAYEFCGGQRLLVTRFRSDHKRLLDVIPRDGIHLPESAKDRLLDAVAALASDIRVQSGVAGGADQVTVQGDVQPWVQLDPVAAGLTVKFVVEPVPETTTYFVVGEGGANVFVSLEGSPVQAARDLVAEKAAAEVIVGACPTLARDHDGRLDWFFGDPEDCLELIDELQKAGARCLWPQDEPYKVVARAEGADLNLTIKSASDWFSASGELQVDDDRVISLARLFELMDASQGSRFLELEDGQFLALSDGFRAQLDEFQALSSANKNGTQKLSALAAIALEELFETAVMNSDGAWEERQRALRAAKEYRPDLPNTLRAELRPYQHEGFEWLAQLSHWGVGACLADDMGLGKTVQALAVLLLRAKLGPALVIAPTSVVPNWIDEAHRFAPTLNVLHYVGAPGEREAMLESLEAFDLVVVTYGLIQNDIERFAKLDWSTLVLDEAHAIKNASTRRARAVKSLKAEFRVATTGTPIQNNLMDLHSLFGFLNPGLLGSAAKYKAKFVLPIERDGDTETSARLRRLISPFVLRRTKTEVLDDLPSRTEITLNVELSEDEATLYEALRTRALSELEDLDTKSPKEREQDKKAKGLAESGNRGGEQHVQVLAHLTKLRLACCHPLLVQDTWTKSSAKLREFARTLDELLAGNHKVLVFSQFVSHLKLIEQYLIDTQVHYQYLDGSIPQKARADRIRDFQSGEGDVFLISLKAGGTGLNLTAADYVIHMDPWWNPAVEDQASDRAHRIGQTRPVTIYRMVAQGTIEEQIVELHRDKRDLADQLLSGADTAARLSTSELLALLREG